MLIDDPRLKFIVANLASAIYVKYIKPTTLVEERTCNPLHWSPLSGSLNLQNFLDVNPISILKIPTPSLFLFRSENQLQAYKVEGDDSNTLIFLGKQHFVVGISNPQLSNGYRSTAYIRVTEAQSFPEVVTQPPTKIS